MEGITKYFFKVYPTCKICNVTWSATYYNDISVASCPLNHENFGVVNLQILGEYVHYVRKDSTNEE